MQGSDLLLSLTAERKVYMKNLSVKKIAILSVTAALYVAVTMALGSLAYGSIQFRISEALVLLCFYKKEYCYSMVVGCLIANIISTVGAIDMIVGTFATLLAVVVIVLCSKYLPEFFIKKFGMSENAASTAALITASLSPVVFNGVLVGLELKYVFDLPLFLSMGQVALGELVCVTVVGVILFKILEKNKGFMKLINFEK